MKIKEFRRGLPRKTLLQLNISNKYFDGVNIKGSTTVYHKTLKSSRKVFNSTSNSITIFIFNLF